MTYIKCIIDHVDQKTQMGVSIDLYSNNRVVINDCGDIHRFTVSSQQLTHIEQTQDIKVALSYKG